MPKPIAYSSIREMVVRGRLAPGAKVTEAELAKRLGISRTPVREALRRLTQERLLESVGRGTGLRDRLAVTEMSAAQARDLYGIAGIIEGFAGRRLTNRSPHDRNTLAAELMEMAQAQQFSGEQNPLKVRFHRRILDAAANAEAAAQFLAIEPQLERYSWFYGSDTGGEHEIAAAIRSGNPAQIEWAIRCYWEELGERVGTRADRSKTNWQLGIQGSIVST